MKHDAMDDSDVAEETNVNSSGEPLATGPVSATSSVPSSVTQAAPAMMGSFGPTDARVTRQTPARESTATSMGGLAPSFVYGSAPSFASGSAPSFLSGLLPATSIGHGFANDDNNRRHRRPFARLHHDEDSSGSSDDYDDTSDDDSVDMFDEVDEWLTTGRQRRRLAREEEEMYRKLHGITNDDLARPRNTAVAPPPTSMVPYVAGVATNEPSWYDYETPATRNTYLEDVNMTISPYSQQQEDTPPPPLVTSPLQTPPPLPLPPQNHDYLTSHENVATTENVAPTENVAATENVAPTETPMWSDVPSTTTGNSFSSALASPGPSKCKRQKCSHVNVAEIGGNVDLQIEKGGNKKEVEGSTSSNSKNPREGKARCMQGPSQEQDQPADNSDTDDTPDLLNSKKASAIIACKRVLKHLSEHMEEPQLFNEFLGENVTQENDVARFVHAAMILATSGNVEVTQGDPLSLNSFALRLLSVDEHLFLPAAERADDAQDPRPPTPKENPEQGPEMPEEDPPAN